MPLHAITEVYGERGLRELLQLELETFAPGERERLRTALGLATRLHADDRRTREPYLNHVLRVAVRIIRSYGIRDVDVLVAALLHDAVEDHPWELADLTPESGFLFGTEPSSIDAGVYGFVANIYFYRIDTPLKRLVASRPNLVRHCNALHAAVTGRAHAPRRSGA